MCLKVSDLEENIESFLTDLRDDELSKSSLQVYKSNITKFIQYLKKENISEFTKNDFINYREYMLDQYKITTLNRYVVVLNKYLNFLGHNELKIKQVKQQRRHYIDNVPTVADYKRILRAAKKHDIQAYYFILIASYTGMRVSAILQITIESLKESRKNENYIKIYSKGKYNEVPFPTWLRREVLKYANERKINTGYLFPSPRIKEKPIHRKTMWKKVHKATGQAKVSLDKGHPHAFRHLLGKEITSRVDDNQIVADILGHESLKTTAQYQQKTKKEIAKIINDFRFK